MTSAKASEAAPGPTALPIIDVSLLDAPAPDSRARLADNWTGPARTAAFST